MSTIESSKGKGKRPASQKKQNLAPNSISSFGGTSVLVHPRQRGNSVLSYIKNVNWEYSRNITPDYVLGATTCALFLSLKYHVLHPEYLYARMSEVKKAFTLRVILCVVDVHNEDNQLNLIMSLAASNGFTVILAWSLAECARYIETFKVYEKKTATAIQEKLDTEFIPRLQDCLTVIRSVNRTDADNLYRNFGSIKGIANAPMDELALCTGLGSKKVQRIYDVFNTEWKVD
uniref:ERCC1-like central domain-containing protein n=1 Tax=Aplanochytrium stocchinoi TaxID=215587 RepID=A0A7S3PR32_9STRA|mmetsp:Transcript_18225/g.20608  ORF Transcript_18225/g.20608 Transcript_18225/m.20608 type:complete len:232 (-) Transcript_18225:79-774(-)